MKVWELREALAAMDPDDLVLLRVHVDLTPAVDYEAFHVESAYVGPEEPAVIIPGIFPRVSSTRIRHAVIEGGPR